MAIGIHIDLMYHYTFTRVDLMTYSAIHAELVQLVEFMSKSQNFQLFDLLLKFIQVLYK